MATKIPPAVAALAPDGDLTARQRRHLMLEMVKRRVRPGSGSAIEFLRRRTAMEKWPDLREILAGIPWVVVGGVATRAYMPERKTMDMDILVHVKAGPDVMQRLQKAGYKIVSPLAVPGYLTRAPNGIDLDVIFGKEPWVREALSKPNRDPAHYPTISLPYLVLMKITASRAQDWTDVSRMLALADAKARDQVRQVIARYSPEDAADLETLIFVGEKELEMPTAKKRTRKTARRQKK